MKTPLFVYRTKYALVRVLICSILLISCLSHTYAQTINWQKALGGTANDTATAILATTDGGYIIAGNTFSTDGDVSGTNTLSQDIWVVKLTSAGTVAWKKTFGGSKDDHVNAITAGPDGSFVLTGITNSSDGDMSDFHTMYSGYYNYLWLFKLSSTGDVIWKQYMDTGRWNYAYAIVQNPAGGYTISGAYFCGGCQSGNDFYVATFDEAGNRIGSSTWPGGRGDDRAYAITYASGGGYLAAGWGNSTSLSWDSFTSANNRGGFDIWLKRSGPNDYYWIKTFGGSGNEYSTAVAATTDGGFIVAGYTTSTDGDVLGNHGGKDAWVFKVNKDGTIVWQKTLGGSANDVANAILLTANGDILVAGSTTSTDGDVAGNHGNEDGWVVKLSAAGNLLWQKTLGGSANDGALAITQSANGQYVLAGYTASTDGDVAGNHGQADYWVVNLSDVPLELLAPSYNCATGLITFTTQGGNGSPIEFMAIGVTPWTTNPSATIEEGVRQDPNSDPIRLFARQNGQVISRMFDFKTFCNGGNQAPVWHGPVPMQTGQVGQPFSYSLSKSLFTDPEGGELSLVANELPPGLYLDAAGWVITGLPTQSGQYLITLTATDPNGTSGTGQFTMLILPAEGTGYLQLTEPLYNCSTGQLTFQTTGGNNTAIEFMAIGVTPWTTNPVQTIELGVRLDSNSQPITLFARQNGIIVTRTFDFRASCQTPGRQLTPSDNDLSVTLLGNPVSDQRVMFEIRGAVGQPVQIRLMSMQGQLISQQRIDRAVPGQRASLLIGSIPGIYLLHIETPSKQLSMRVLKH